MYCVQFFVFCMVVAFAYGCSGGRQMIKSGGLSEEEKQAIVDSHNRLRQSVALGQVRSQPPAANMMEMKWDDELAARAQSWADQCITAHDAHHARDVGRFKVGQNLAASWTSRRPSAPKDTTPDFDKQIQAWFDEVRAYGFKSIGGDRGTGHYSQLVWSESSHVGCGFTFYYDAPRGYVKLYVCNYGPSGNVVGLKPYEKGQPACNNFGLSDSQNYNGLCDIYQNTIEETYGQGQYNSIPESAPDAIDTTSFNAFNYKAYGDYSTSNSNNDNSNSDKNANHYPWQISTGDNSYYYQNQQQQEQQKQETFYSQQHPQQKNVYDDYQQKQIVSKIETIPASNSNNNYNSDNVYVPQFTTPKPVTFKPFVSLFNDAASTFETAAKKVINNVVHTKRGFRFGTLFL